MTSGVATAEDPLSKGSPLSSDTVCSQKKTNENNRRSNKPIMEKKRRARINNCLNELKSLILDATKKDPARHSKLEKADILEMTVKHLESMQKQGVALSNVSDPSVANKFKAGFTECTNEVSRFPGLEPNVRNRLMQHLTTYFNKEVSSGTGPKLPPRASADTANLQLHLDSSQNAILLGSAGSTCGVQLVPTRLPNGDIALILPSRPAEQTPPPPPPLSLVIPTPPSTRSESSGTESPMPDRPSSCYSMVSCDSSDSYSQSDLPLALVTKQRNEENKSDLEQPWRPW
ncbi:protein hairy [Daktulosphaira vitifoliae]|uniref:protein hairy n=1 Tax=Daktulosphaira vitifoliae TaxID=58002 RepID=UPI0021AA34C4|nr:protein hairy [Daktulosphaira vitifoliae]